MENKKRCFILGGLGFIGGYLINRLIEQGYPREHFDIRTGEDIRNMFDLDKSIELFQPDIVINMAAQAGVRRGNEYPVEYFSTNCQGTKNVIDVCEKHGVEKLIHFSSSSVYGDKMEKKTEECELDPKSWYGLTKRWSEDICNMSKINNVFIVRPFTVYGLNGRLDQVIYKWINQIKKGEPITKYGNGMSVRGYTHVEDLVDGVMKIIECDLKGKHTFNLGGNEPVALNRLIGLFSNYKQDLKITEMMMPECDNKYSIADTTKAEELLGWKPTRKFDKEVKNIIKKEL